MGHGYFDKVVEAARSGQWYCADRAARGLTARGDWEAAWELVAPYTESGGWGAVEAAAQVLASWGRTDDAVALVRRHAHQEERLAVRLVAVLLAGGGRVDEAIEVLRPHLADWYLLEGLVEATTGRGRDRQVADLLRPWAARRPHSWEPSNAVVLLARVVDRDGQAEEAVAVLRGHVEAGCQVTQNEIEELAGLLARHDRLDELRELAATDRYAACSVGPLADRLVDLDDPDAGIAVLRSAHARNVPQSGSRLVSLLGRMGRLDETADAAVPVLTDAGCACQLPEVMEYFVDGGRVDLAFDVLDKVTAGTGEAAEYAPQLRPWLLSEAGRHEEAIAAETARPRDEYGDRARGLARALESAGRLDEASTVLDEASSTTDYLRTALARLLIRNGCPDEAIAAHQRPESSRPNRSPGASAAAPTTPRSEPRHPDAALPRAQHGRCRPPSSFLRCAWRRSMATGLRRRVRSGTPRAGPRADRPGPGG